MDYKTITKRLKSIVSALALMLLVAATPAKAEVIVTISQPRIQVNVSYAQTYDITISVKQTDGETFQGFNGDLYLSNGVTFEKFDDGSYVQKSTDRCTSSHTVAAAVRDDIAGKPLRFMLYSMNKNVKGTDGVVLTFRVKVPAYTDSFEITLKDSKVGTYAVTASAKSLDANKYINIFGWTSDVFSGRTSTVYLYDFFNGLGGAGEGFVAFSADIVLPAGIEPALDADGDPILWTKASHMISLTKLSAENEYRMLAYSATNASFNNGGIFARFDIKSSFDLAEESEIVIKNIKAVTGYAETIPHDDVIIPVVNMAANRLYPAQDLTINPGEEQLVWINLHNVTDSITSVQGDVVLPEGLELVPFADGEGSFSYATGRATLANHAVVENNVNVTVDGKSVPGTRFMLYSGSNSLIKKEYLWDDVAAAWVLDADGNRIPVEDLVCFKVKATSALADTTAIKLTNLSFVLAKSLKYSFEDFEVKVVNPNVGASAGQAQTVADAQAAFAAATAYIAENCADVTALVAADSAAIAAQIEALAAKVAEYSAAGTAQANAAAIQAEAAAIAAAVAAYQETAVIQQTAFDNNVSAYTDGVKSLDDLKAQYAAVKAQIEAMQVIVNDGKAKNDVLTKSAEVESAVNALYAEAEAAFAAGTAVDDIDAIKAKVPAVVDKIKSLTDFAGAAEEAYVANKTQYDADKAQIDALKATFAGYKAEINALEFVKNQGADAAITLAAVAEVDALISDLYAKAEASYKAETSIKDQVTFQVAVAMAQIKADQVKSDALKIEQTYSANAKQYAADKALIKGVADALAAAKAELATYADSVSAKFADRVAALEAQIAGLEAAAEASFKAETSVADASTLSAQIASIKVEIANLQAEAKAANDIALGVKAINAVQEAQYYSISGKLLDGPVSGQINIVKYPDGSVKKLFIE